MAIVWLRRTAGSYVMGKTGWKPANLLRRHWACPEASNLKAQSKNAAVAGTSPATTEREQMLKLDRNPVQKIHAGLTVISPLACSHRSA